jgi:hypothetical protein
MAKEMNPQQKLEAQEIGKRYSELMAMRPKLMSQKMLEVEAEMAQAKAEFGEFLQRVYESEDSPYTWNISTLATAMGIPSSRQTVKRYLDTAVERRKNRFLDGFNTDTLGLEIVDIYTERGADMTSYYAVVANLDASHYYKAMLRNLKNRYTTYEIDPDKDYRAADNFIYNDSFNKMYQRPSDMGTAPEWLQWLDQQQAWRELLGEA